MQNYKSQKGGLMIELIISIGILGLIAAITFPNLKQFLSDLKLDNITKQIVTDLRYAQQLTVTEQNVYKVKFLISEFNSSYKIIKDDGEETIKEEFLPKNIGYETIQGFTDDEVIFNFLGAVYESGTTTLMNVSTGNSNNIFIKPSGYISHSL